MYWLLIPVGLALVNAFWLVLVLVGLPGTWLIVASCALVDWWTDKELFSTPTLLAAVALAALGEVVELMAGSAGARKAGGGRRGSWGALGGGIAGAILGTFFIPIPLFGSLIGAGIGAFAAASFLEHDGGKDMSTALRIGRGAAWGQFLGTFAKLLVGISVWLLVSIASFV
ncbi:MAG: hypothetical protein ACI87O_001826 [Planctomycetota bacterium]|jgi:uncharacterized protein YqgC (DUF456 family)